MGDQDIEVWKDWLLGRQAFLWDFSIHAEGVGDQAAHEGPGMIEEQTTKGAAGSSANPPPPDGGGWV